MRALARVTAFLAIGTLLISLSIWLVEEVQFYLEKGRFFGLGWVPISAGEGPAILMLFAFLCGNPGGLILLMYDLLGKVKYRRACLIVVSILYTLPLLYQVVVSLFTDAGEISEDLALMIFTGPVALAVIFPALFMFFTRPSTQILPTRQGDRY